MLIVNGRLAATGKAQVATFAHNRGLSSEMLFDEISNRHYNKDEQIVKYCEDFMYITSLLRLALRKEA